MPMAADDIIRLIKEGIPDAEVEIQDLAGDGDHYAATVVSAAFAGKSKSSSTRWSTVRWVVAWAACCMR